MSQSTSQKRKGDKDNPFKTSGRISSLLESVPKGYALIEVFDPLLEDGKILTMINIADMGSFNQNGLKEIQRLKNISRRTGKPRWKKTLEKVLKVKDDPYWSYTRKIFNLLKSISKDKTNERLLEESRSFIPYNIGTRIFKSEKRFSNCTDLLFPQSSGRKSITLSPGEEKDHVKVSLIKKYIRPDLEIFISYWKSYCARVFATDFIIPSKDGDNYTRLEYSGDSDLRCWFYFLLKKRVPMEKMRDFDRVILNTMVKESTKDWTLAGNEKEFYTIAHLFFKDRMVPKGAFWGESFEFDEDENIVESEENPIESVRLKDDDQRVDAKAPIFRETQRALSDLGETSKKEQRRIIRTLVEIADRKFQLEAAKIIVGKMTIARLPIITRSLIPKLGRYDVLDPGDVPGAKAISRPEPPKTGDKTVIISGT